MSYSMSIRSRAANTNAGAGAALGTDEDPPLEMGRDLHAGEREHGRREIDEADELVAHGARRHRRAERLRPSDHQRHAEARVVERSLGARHAVAVVAPIEDDRVVRQAVVFELLQDLADLRVHVGDVVVHAGELFADGGVSG